MKKTWEISSYYTSVPKIRIICYTVLEIWHVTDVIVIFHFGLFFAPLVTAQKMKIKKKKKKNPLEISSLYTTGQEKLGTCSCCVPAVHLK